MTTDWKTAHDNLAARNALLRQRHDLPVDRIPAHAELVRLQEENARLRAQPEGKAITLLKDAARAWNNEASPELDATMERIESFLLGSSAQPEGEAPQAAPLSEVQIDRIARAYFSEQWAVQHAKDAIHDAFEDARKSATLSPLCGAQHAESGKEVSGVERALLAEVLAAHDQRTRVETAAMGFGLATNPLMERVRAALAAQQAAAPGALAGRIISATPGMTIIEVKIDHGFLPQWLDPGYQVRVGPVAPSAPDTPEAPKRGVA